MTATGHALIGAAIATKISNPLISLPIIFAGHLLGDKLPHWDPMTKAKDKSRQLIIVQTAIDVLISYSLVFFIFIWYQGQDPAYMLVAAFAAQGLDWLEVPHLFSSWRPKISEASYQIQKWSHDYLFDARLAAPWGILSQAIVIAIFLLWSFS